MTTLLFGAPWDAPVCEDATFLPEVPTYARCARCGELFVDGDQGMVIPASGAIEPELLIGVRGGPGDAQLVGQHRECLLAATVGHTVGVCSCTGYGPTRAAGREVLRRVQTDAVDHGAAALTAGMARYWGYGTAPKAASPPRPAEHTEDPGPTPPGAGPAGGAPAAAGDTAPDPDVSQGPVPSRRRWDVPAEAAPADPVVDDPADMREWAPLGVTAAGLVLALVGMFLGMLALALVGAAVTVASLAWTEARRTQLARTLARWKERR